MAPSICRTNLERPRHKTVSGLRPSKSQAIAVRMEDVESDKDAMAEDYLQSSNTTEPLVRQFHCDTRFPQRKRTANDPATPKLQPSSIDKFISGIWRQVHSPITLSVSFPVSILPTKWLSMSTNADDCAGSQARIQSPHWCQPRSMCGTLPIMRIGNRLI